ncbi:MAG: trigger factor [Candidatus Pacebacteria bacterium]|jgi:trigger factor|nr:hypothetical protein [bacterium]MDP6527337.1 trigger factor [Candidatus Paceibacterota bacterium]MDP6659385.1 trigger factor [Candidatus Paceibacterota bacterium]|tara:strand:+ start:42818 stop:43888 length:1071 start_codon:yes stop_codon:yes gene_type:complete
MSELYTNIELKKKDGSVEITGDVPVETVSKYRSKAIKTLGKDASIQGFRKGHVPEDILVPRLGEQAIMEETAQSALSDVYPALVLEHKLRVIGSPQIAITKLAAGNPIGFKITSVLFPEVTLPNYKEIANEVYSKKEDVLVTDEDVEKMLLEVRRGKARFENTKETKEGEEPKEIKDEELPELDDEFIKTLGNFEGIEDFKNKVREDIKKQKEFQANDKTRNDLSDELVKKSKINVPEILVEHELDRMKAQMKEDVERIGATWDKYLEQINKKEEDLRKEWRESADKRARLQLILNAISEREDIKPDKKEVEHQVGHILESVKGAKKENVEAYVEMMLTNQKVFEYLEGQSLASEK